jgi:pyruvate/2-oxoglutarate dehydrogenase complex dihydrolipoamide dehydrogenase (E3) component
MTPARYDVLVIGAGQAGIPLAHALAGRGRTVAVAERRDLGGSCVNFGCTPTKAALASARIAHQARRAAAWGVQVDGVRVDFPAVLARARAIAAESRAGLERGFPGGNPALLRGAARLTGRDGASILAEVDGRPVAAAHVVLNTGTRTRLPDTPGIDALDVLHAGNWLHRDDRPAHLAMLGGGVIALEMSQFYARMGCRVTLLERSARLAGREDPDVSDALRRVLEAEGVEVRTDTNVERMEPSAAGARLHLRRGDARETLEVSHVFAATGRRPNTDDLGLASVGITPDPHGFVPVDERLATPAPGVWAAGDIRGGPQFTHTAWDDHRILLAQLTGEGARTTRRIVPYAIFTDPEFGRVGVGEREARERGLQVDVHRYELANNGRARELGATEGFIKVLVERGSQRIAGAAVLAESGAELVHLYVDLMNAGAPATVIRDAVHIHPTLAEAVQSAVAAV